MTIILDISELIHAAYQVGGEDGNYIGVYGKMTTISGSQVQEVKYNPPSGRKGDKVSIARRRPF